MAKFDIDHCQCHHCHMLTNKMDSDQTEEFNKTRGRCKGKEQKRKHSNVSKSQRDE